MTDLDAEAVALAFLRRRDPDLDRRHADMDAAAVETLRSAWSSPGWGRRVRNVYLGETPDRVEVVKAKIFYRVGSGETPDRVEVIRAKILYRVGFPPLWDPIARDYSPDLTLAQVFARNCEVRGVSLSRTAPERASRDRVEPAPLADLVRELERRRRLNRPSSSPGRPIARP